MPCILKLPRSIGYLSAIFRLVGYLLKIKMHIIFYHNLHILNCSKGLRFCQVNYVTEGVLDKESNAVLYKCPYLDLLIQIIHGYLGN